MGIDLLGPLDVGVPLEPRDRIALSALALRRGRLVAPDELAEALWGDTPPATWPKQVQICIGRLRKALGADVIETLPGGYRLALSADELDTERFERLAERGRTLAAAGEPVRAAVAFRRALELWRGHPLQELDGWPPGHSEAARLEELRRTIEEDELDARLAAGEHRQVAGAAEALVGAEPWRERRWVALALARYRCGRQADALEALRNARRTLADQLGLDPSPELAAHEVAILRQDPSLQAPPEPASVSDDCPYKGLVPYAESDAEGFFGRDAEVAACLERLRTSSLLVLAGPSGCGKSSLLRAGLVPALRRRGAAPVLITPGPDPDAAWATAVESTEPVLVDQLEELGDDVQPFLARVVEHRGPVILAVRSDYLGRLAVDARFTRLAERGLHLLNPLAGDALRQAIEQPALRAGLRVEPGLTDVLLRDSEGEPGALPLLSHALVETWKRRDGNVLTVDGYRESGGIRAAVARSADRLYDNLDPAQRALVRSILLRLVAPSDTGDPVRSRVPSRALLGDPGHERMVALLVRSRLVTAEEDTFELAHEALARAWPRLQAWLDEDVAGQRILRHLSATADGWDSLGRPASELYRGARLDAALEWRETAERDLTPVERAFLEASAEAAESRARRDARQNRRLRVLLGVAVALLAVATVAGAVALDGRHDARAAQATALHEALLDRSLALRGTDRSVAALLAVEAYRRRPDAHAWSALLGTFTAEPTFLGTRYLPGDRVGGVLVPGTSTAIVALDDRQLQLMDLTTGVLDDRFPALDAKAEPASMLRTSADGRYVAQMVPSSCADRAGCAVFSVFEIASGRRVMGPIVPPVGPGDLALDGAHVAVAGGGRGDVAVYRIGGKRPVAVRPGLIGPRATDPGWDTASLGFGPDGRLYAGSLAGPIRALDPDSLAVQRTFAAPPGFSHIHVVATRDVLVAGGAQGLMAFDLRTGAKRWSADLQADRKACLALAVSADRLYCGGLFGVIEERDLANGARTGVDRSPQLGAIADLCVAGRELVAFGAEAPAVSRWRLDGSGLVTRLIAAGQVTADAYARDGRSLLVARRSDAELTDVSLWDPAADKPLMHYPPAGGMGWIAPNTLVGRVDGKPAYLAAATGRALGGQLPPGRAERILPAADGRRFFALLPGAVWTFDAATRRRIAPTIKLPGMPWAVSATRERIVVTTLMADDQEITVHDATTGKRLAGPLHGMVEGSVSPDGVLVATDAGEITQYDLDTLKPIASFPGARGEVNTLQFSNDSKTLLATSLDQTVSIYDVATRSRIGDPIAVDAPFIYPGYLRPDGKAVAVTVRDGVNVWDIDPEHLRAAACVVAGRNLTRTEWETYVGSLGPYRRTCV